MKNFTFAVILGAAASQEDIDIMNDTLISDSVSGPVTSTGSTGEWTYTEADGAITAGMYIHFSTACNGCMFANGALV